MPKPTPADRYLPALNAIAARLERIERNAHELKGNAIRSRMIGDTARNALTELQIITREILEDSK